MFKQSLYLLFLLPISIFAQKKVDLDKFGFTVQFRSLPNYRLDSTYRTYNVEVEGTKLMETFHKGAGSEKECIAGRLEKTSCKMAILPLK